VRFEGTARHADDAAAFKRLRVTQLALSDSYAGTESHVALLGQQLVALGVRARLVCGNQNERLIDEASAFGIDVRTVRLGKGNVPENWFAAYRDIMGWRPHLVHAHLGSSLLCGTVLTLAGRRPLVFTQHFIKPAYREASGLKAGSRTIAHRLIHKRVAGAIATTHVARMEMVTREGFDADRVTVIPLGIDIDHVTIAARHNQSSIHAELGLHHAAALIITPARLEQEKGHATLLAAMPLVLERCPTAYLLLAGEGALRESLENESRRLGVAKRVRFLGQRTDVPRLLAHSSLCVLPSYQEPFGLALLEAMAVGAPIVACDAGGPRDIVVHGETGLLAPPHEPQPLAAAIIAMLTDTARAREMGAAGQRRVKEHFSAQRMAEHTMRVYRDVMRR
jgi:glycosyltransferase involved in cell wall biosynthesis